MEIENKHVQLELRQELQKFKNLNCLIGILTASKKRRHSDSYDYRGEQKKFVDRELDLCNSDYCLVIGHHPILSNGIMGPTPGVIEDLHDLLDHHKIGKTLGKNFNGIENGRIF